MTAESPRGDGRRLTIVTPVFNDWESFRELVQELETALADLPMKVSIVAVDDASTIAMPAALPMGPAIERIECLRLATNVGHQRAIAIGLMSIATDCELDLVAVMDADGEDLPAELRAMIGNAIAKPDNAVVAQRKERSEGVLFRIFYWLYVRLFRLLTGHSIGFGNFSVLQREHVHRVSSSQHVWNNFPASLIKERIPVSYLPTRRGSRYAGQSSMNFVGLIAHGLGAISVFSEAVFVRILIASSAMLTLSIGLALTALAIKFGTDLALPNWTTTVFGFALVVSLQALMLPILMAFMLLNNRAAVHPLPASVALSLIAAKAEIGVTAGKADR